MARWGRRERRVLGEVEEKQEKRKSWGESTIFTEVVHFVLTMFFLLSFQD